MRILHLHESAVPVMLLSISVACGGNDGGEQREQEGNLAPEEEIMLADVGFATPESVRHDAVTDVYLVSNINGDPFAADGNGFISRISPAGEILDLKWIDGEAEGVTLNAPKGMAIADDRLYVTDINTVRVFDRTTGEPVGEIALDGTTFLNDAAAGMDGSIYITDSGFNPGFAPSGTDAVYRISPDGSIETLATGSVLGGPNGVALVNGAVWVVSFGSGELYRIADGGAHETAALPSGSLDGLEGHAGQLFVSSWEGQSILRGTPGGTFAVAFSGLEAPADFGIDATRDRLLVPLFQANEVRIIPMAPASSE
jgi:hypothetical protein